MADEFVIRRAERTQTRLRIALQGSSGGGKTATSLLVAKGMVAELERRSRLPTHLDGAYIGVLDTERDSAKLYSHLVPFDTITLGPPYTVDRYLAALTALERVGYPVIIIDQISHEWSGEGGILTQVANSRASNDFAKWNGPSQEHERFVDRLLDSPAHLILTMRAKTEWVLEEVDNGRGGTKKVPKRIGMQAKQREGTEYEWTTLLDLEVGTNAATCLKDRTELFQVNGRVGRMGADWGARFIEWVYSAKAPEPLKAAEPTPAEKVEALLAAGIRSVERAPNQPDLVRAFDTAQKALRALSVEAGREVVAPALERLIAAKDAAKAAFGGHVPAPVSGEPVSPDEVLVLELLLTDAAITPDVFKAAHGLQRLAMLPASKYEEAVDWILSAAGAAGKNLERPRRPVPVLPEVEQSLPERVNDMVTAIGNERGGSGLFSPTGGLAEMRDDLPWDR
jgi:hypothetical protein